MKKATYQIDYETVKTVVRERYAIWIAIYTEIESRVRELQHNQRFRIDGLQHLLVMALFARTVSNTSAAMLVAEHGYEVQCKTLLRTALESMFALAATAKIQAWRRHSRRLASANSSERYSRHVFGRKTCGHHWNRASIPKLSRMPRTSQSPQKPSTYRPRRWPNGWSS